MDFSMADTAKGYKTFFHIPSELAAPLHTMNLQICREGGSRRDLSCVKSTTMRSELWAHVPGFYRRGRQSCGETIAASRRQLLARYSNMGPGIVSYRDQ
jgi:hypothetical protein